MVCGSGAAAPASAAWAANSSWNLATKASRSASGTEASATTPSNAPTGTVSPSPTTIRRSGPATGLSNTFAILDVSMSRISSPALISVPASTNHLATIPSCIASPHLGMTIGLIASLMAPPSRFVRLTRAPRQTIQRVPAAPPALRPSCRRSEPIPLADPRPMSRQASGPASSLPPLSSPSSCAPPPRSWPGSGCTGPRGRARTAPARAARSPSGSAP